MSSRLPEYFEPFRFVEQGRTLSGTVAQKGMNRLGEMVVTPGGEVEVELHFGFDERNRAQVTGRLAADVQLICQRCMQPMDWHVETQVQLLIAHTDAEAEFIGPGEEALIADTERQSLPDLVEDELLLALPLVARHGEGVCSAVKPEQDKPDEVEIKADTGQGRRNPFEVLGQLKSPTKH